MTRQDKPATPESAPTASEQKPQQWSLSVEDAFDACLMLSLIDILLWGTKVWYTGAMIYIFVLPALVMKRVRYSPWAWIGIALSFAILITINWAIIDNHKYVMAYWCLGIASALFVDQSARNDVFKTNARYILGLSMLFATLWKAINWEYMSGAFFEILFLTDVRLEGTVALLTDMTRGELYENRERVRMMTEGYMNHIDPQSVQLNSSSMVKWMAFAATWWTVLIEGFKGILFVLPMTGRTIFLLRNFSLVIFLFTTYAIAPVPGFGCTLSALGMATCIEQGRNSWFRFYQVAFVYVIIAWIAAEPLRQLLLKY